MKITHALTLVVTSTLFATVAAAAPRFEGCYTPIRGFATSLCDNVKACDAQTGIFHIVLRNPAAQPGKRRLTVSGILRGQIVQMPNACGLADAQHVLTDKKNRGTIATGADVGCPNGEGDFLTTIGLNETLTVREGDGIYSNIVPGGTITLRGTLGLVSGINQFELNAQPTDEICFSDI